MKHLQLLFSDCKWTGWADGCVSFVSTEAWRWLRTERWKMRRRWRSIQELQLKEAKHIAEEADRKYEEVQTPKKELHRESCLWFPLVFECLMFRLSDFRWPVNWWSWRVSWREQRRGQRLQNCKYKHTDYNVNKTFHKVTCVSVFMQEV